MDENKVVSEGEGFLGLSEADKVLFLLYDLKKSTRKQLTHMLLCVPSVPSVTLVPPVPETPELGYEGYGRYQSYGVHDFKTKSNTVKRCLNLKKEYISIDKSKPESVYSLNPNGEKFVEERVEQFKKEEEERIKAKRYKSKEIEMFENLKEYLSREEMLVQLINAKNKVKRFELNYKELSEFDIDLAEELANKPEEFLKRIKTALSQINEDYEDLPIFINPSVSQSMCIRITDLRTYHLERLICFDCEIYNRSSSLITINSIKFECPSCGNIITILQQGKKIRTPSKCGCGRNGGFNKIYQELSDCLKLEVNDLYENLGDEDREPLRVILKGNFNFNELKTGEKVKIVGFTNFDSTEGLVDNYKIFNTLGIERLNKDYSVEQISKEDKERFLEISKDPFKYFQDKLFFDLYDMEEETKIITLLSTSKLNAILLGLPGLGKSEACKRMDYVLPRSAFVNCVSATAPGVLGSVIKNKFLERNSLGGGVLQPLHPGGICFLDEFNRDKDWAIQSAILGVMADKKLNVHKAEVHLSSDCDITIIGTANPAVSSYNPTKPEYENFGILHPLWDRADIKLYFHNKLPLDDEKVMIELISKARKGFSLVETELSIIKKYLIYAQKIKVKFTDEDYKRLYYLTRDFLSKIEADPSFRRIGTLKGLLEGVCRLYHRNHTELQDFMKVTDTMTNIVNSKIKFMEACGVTNPITKEEKIGENISYKIMECLEKEEIIEIGTLLVKTGLTDENEFDKAIAHLKQKGDIFEPKPGFIKRVQ